MSSFRFGPILPAIATQREHDELVRRWLALKPSPIDRNNLSNGSSDDDEIKEQRIFPGKYIQNNCSLIPN